MATSIRYVTSGIAVDPNAALNLAGTLAGAWAGDLNQNAAINSVTIYVELTGAGWVDDTWGIVTADAEYASTSQASITVSGSGYSNSTQTWGPTTDSTVGTDAYRIDELDVDLSYAKSKGPDGGSITLTTNSYVEINYEPGAPQGTGAITATAVLAGSGSAPTTPGAHIWSDDFESYTVDTAIQSQFDAGFNTYCRSQDGSQVMSPEPPDTTAAWIGRNLTISDTFHITFDLYMLSWPSALQWMLRQVLASGVNEPRLYLDNSPQGIYAQITDTVTTALVPLSLNTWYRVVWQYDGATNSLSVTPRAGGSTVTETVAETSTVDVNQLRLGHRYGDLGDRYYIDNVRVLESPPAQGTGAITASAVLAGSGSPGTGTPSGTGAVTATTALASSGSTARSGTGAVAAAAVLAGSGSGLEFHSGTGAIAATSSLAGSGSAALSGTGAVAASAVLAGSGDTARAGSGAVTASAGLASSGSTVRVGTGAVTATAALAGAGTGSEFYSGTGAITATAALSGSGDTARAGTGSLSAAGVLAGGGSSAPTGTGAITATAALAGSGVPGGPLVVVVGSTTGYNLDSSFVVDLPLGWDADNTLVLLFVQRNTATIDLSADSGVVLDEVTQASMQRVYQVRNPAASFTVTASTSHYNRWVAVALTNATSAFGVGQGGSSSTSVIQGPYIGHPVAAGTEVLLAAAGTNSTAVWTGPAGWTDIQVSISGNAALGVWWDRPVDVAEGTTVPDVDRGNDGVTRNESITAVYAWHVAEAFAGTGTITATADLAGTGLGDRAGQGGISAAAVVAGFGSSARSGAGAVAAATALTGTGSAAMSGTGSLFATASLAGNGTSAPVGTGAITATSTLDATGNSSRAGAAAVTATSTFFGSGSSTRTGDVAITAASALSGIGGGGEVPRGTGNITAVAGLAAAGVRRATGSGQDFVTTSLAADGITARYGSGDVAGLAVLYGSGNLPGGGQGAITATAVLGGGGWSSRAGSAAVTAFGQLAGSGYVPGVGLGVSVWDGTVEIRSAVSVWDGTVEVDGFVSAVL